MSVRISVGKFNEKAKIFWMKVKRKCKTMRTKDLNARVLTEKITCASEGTVL